MMGYIPTMDSSASGMKRATLSDRPKPADGSINVFKQALFLSAATMDANVLDDDGAAYSGSLAWAK